MDLWNNHDTGASISDGTVWRYHRFDSADSPADPYAGTGFYSFFDGTTFKYQAGQPNASPPIAGVALVNFSDGTIFEYNAATSVSTQSYVDGAVVKYDATAHAFSIALPSGSTMSITANGATISIDASGNVGITAAGGINLVTGTHNDSVDNIINVFNAHVHGDPTEGDTTVPTALLT